MIAHHIYHINPLLPETFFSSILRYSLKMGSYRLPTHRRDTRRKFFSMIPSYFKNEILTNKWSS